jgi:hypothetical protein
LGINLRPSLIGGMTGLETYLISVLHRLHYAALREAIIIGPQNGVRRTGNA